MTSGFVSPSPQAVAAAVAAQDQMRAYRACLHCRGRKTKCNLEANGGRPPCKRCQREHRECVLGESHRGGRRERKKPKPVVNPIPDSSKDQEIGIQSNGFSDDPLSGFDERPSKRQSVRHDTFSHGHNRTASWGGGQTNAAASDSSDSYRAPTQTSSDLGPYHAPIQTNLHAESAKSSPGITRRESLAGTEGTDLQNPSDALEILARVADRAEGGSAAGGQGSAVDTSNIVSSTSWKPPENYSSVEDIFYYKPVSEGLISHDMVYHLFSTFQNAYHPFFPIVPRETFDPQRIPWLSKTEPHLFSAILTIASKDDEAIHQICYDHMQSLISLILAGADADVEAVEALLLLSQWVSHRPQAAQRVGRGEEDRVAWMCIGTALRLAYFLGLDRTSFRGESSEDPAKFNRKRLVWSACYVADRSVSVRLGKGFWARGPGPLAGQRSSDFPTLQPTAPHEDDWSKIYQANLELTQIFGNVYDILYSCKTHGWRQMIEGRYAKYLDDFRMSIRNWHDTWGTLDCSPRLKASLILTYEYLRLYANAFAYQATISRAMIYSRASATHSIPAIDAAAPDARFIYDAIDAAKSLLSTFNTFMEPEMARYMPSSYYLYIIYSAVFLYKARSTTTMLPTERASIRALVGATIDRLNETSTSANHMGSRYSRLLQLLWRKSPRAAGAKDGPAPHDPLQPTPHTAAPLFQLPGPDGGNGNASDLAAATAHFAASYAAAPPELDAAAAAAAAGSGGGGNTFSWLDLDGAWNFAMANQGAGGMGEMDDGGWGGMGEAGGAGLSPFEMELGGFGVDWNLLNEDDPGLIF